uniref:Uncharacterized protein n=1 Tax=Agrobacterium tumefaciens TaxID=358 RepID=A0A2Z2PSK3_AGRTU|nr:hypothetical protein [Agrobacterium tumefaciens]ASK45107.1 hypothetical protein [Agrobacterium radiobacter]
MSSKPPSGNVGGISAPTLRIGQSIPVSSGRERMRRPLSRSGYRRARPPEREAFLCRYRSNLAAITAERKPEIDALSRKLARQEAAIALLRGPTTLPGGFGRTELHAGGDNRRS